MSADDLAKYRRPDGSVVCVSVHRASDLTASCWTRDGRYVGRLSLFDLTPINGKAQRKVDALNLVTQPRPRAGAYPRRPSARLRRRRRVNAIAAWARSRAA